MKPRRKKGPLIAVAAIAAVILLIVWARTPKTAYRANFGSLQALRAAVENYEKANGKFPDKLEDLGPYPMVVGLKDRHPGAEPWNVLPVDLSRLPVNATFMTPGPVPNGAWLFGAWTPGKNVMTQDEMTCDSRACWVTRKITVGKRMYGMFDKATMASLVPMGSHAITLRYPYGTAVIELNASELPDTGQWAYDRKTGTIFLACTHRDGWPGQLPLYQY